MAMKNLLFYKKKAKAWEEALPVGNGRIGAMVFGNLKTEVCLAHCRRSGDDEECIHLS